MEFLNNVRCNSGLASDPDWRRFVVRWSLVSLLLIAVAAYFSYGFFQFDEHYQVVEFVGYKLGKTPRTELAWEFRDRIRPWFQPAMYYAAAKTMMGLGVENPFLLATGFRAISGLCGWLAVTALMLSARVVLADDRQKRIAVMMLALLWLIPYLAVRTSSESLAGDFFSLGLAALLLGGNAARRGIAARSDASTRSEEAAERTVAEGGIKFSSATVLIAGLCFGLAFEFRFQIAFAVMGVMAWILFRSAESWRGAIGKLLLLSVGVAVPIVLGTVIDRWGYGEWTIVPWNYFRKDVLEGRPSLDGTHPVWWYFIGMNAHPLAPITLALAAGMLITWIRFPRHIITWATLPFFVAHSLVPHKEARYLFPMAMLATFLFVVAFVPSADSRPRPAWLDALWNRRRLWAKALVTVNALGLLYVCFLTHEPSVAFQRYVYNQFPNGCTMYVLGKETRSPFENVGATMFFYRPPNFSIRRLKDDHQLEAIVRSGKENFLVVRDRLAEWSCPGIPPADVRLVYSTYPSWFERYNCFNWLQNSKRFNLYSVDRPTTATSQLPLSGLLGSPRTAAQTAPAETTSLR
jgi:phosphatidylinositol glycan class B